MSIDLFSYSDSWLDKVHKDTFSNYLKQSYIKKSLLLLPTIPFDLLILICLVITFPLRKPSRHVYITDKFPGLFSHEQNNRPVCAGPISWLKYCYLYRASYLPVSLIYCLVGLIPWHHSSTRRLLNTVGPKLAQLLLILVADKNSTLVLHSDALPFARCFVQASKFLGMRSCCIQHGIFHDDLERSEVDGIYCDINVVRSEKDRELIAKYAPESKYIVIPDFFIPETDTTGANFDSESYICLVGEGFHILDEEFSRAYIAELLTLEQRLLDEGYKVLYRPHPSEKDLAESFGFKNLDRGPVAETLKNATALIGFSSTLLLEAASIGVPSFQIAVNGIFRSGLSRGNTCIYKFNINEVSQLYAAPTPKSENRQLSKNRKSIAAKELIKSITAICTASNGI